MKVFKFGGASVKNAQAVKNVASILSLYKGEKLGVVISAMGKTTNAMEKLIDAHWNNNKDLLKLKKSLLFGDRSSNPICKNCNRKVTPREEKRIARLRQEY